MNLNANTFVTTIEIGNVRAAMIADALRAAGVEASASEVQAAARRCAGSWICPAFGTVRVPTHPRYTEVGTMERALLDWTDENVERNLRPRAWTYIVGHLLLRYTRGNFSAPSHATLRAWVAPVVSNLRLAA